MVGTNLSVSETQALMAYGNEVRRSYRAEEKFAAAAGAALESSVMMETGTMGLEGLYKMAAGAPTVTASCHRPFRSHYYCCFCCRCLSSSDCLMCVCH